MSDRNDLYIAAARNILARIDDDDVAVSDDATVDFVKDGIDQGAWVQAWVWVREDDIALENDDDD